MVVTDTGPGIDLAVANRLFTPFATTKPTGTGLGLTVAQRVAREHGGTLTAANRPGGGACFTLLCPPWRSRMPKLLVVDDEPLICQSFHWVFATGEVEVVTAGTVAEGWQRVEEDHPDVIVLDLQLPDGSGLDLFDRIRAADPKRPVIFLTAHGTTETAIEAMKRGAFDYLGKPFDLEQMTGLLERAFEAARLMREPAAFRTIRRPIGSSAALRSSARFASRSAESLRWT